MKDLSRSGILYRLCLIVPTLVAIMAFMFVALSRVANPFALEWLESGSYLVGVTHSLGQLCALR